MQKPSYHHYLSILALVSHVAGIVQAASIHALASTVRVLQGGQSLAEFVMPQNLLTKTVRQLGHKAPKLVGRESTTGRRMITLHLIDFGILRRQLTSRWLPGSSRLRLPAFRRHTSLDLPPLPSRMFPGVRMLLKRPTPIMEP